MSEPTWESVDDYWDGLLLLHPDPVLDAAHEANVAAGLPAIDVSPAQGKQLHLLARTIGARRILEVGTLGGYSTIWLARALPADGRLITCEIDPRYAEVATSNLARAGLDGVVDVRVGPALDTLGTLEGPFDLAFIDADKASNSEYFQHAVRLSRPGGMIIVDNVVRSGAVADTASTDPMAVDARRFAEALAADDRVDATVIQTVGRKGHDGFALAVVR
ncbi:MAG: O-methyltransferase [Pseudonocardia sp.]